MSKKNRESNEKKLKTVRKRALKLLEAGKLETMIVVNGSDNIIGFINFDHVGIRRQALAETFANLEEHFASKRIEVVRSRSRRCRHIQHDGIARVHRLTVSIELDES